MSTAIESRQPPLDAKLRHIYDVAVGIDKDETVQYVLDLIESQEDNEVLVAFFLSGATIKEISNSLRIPEDVLALFSWLVIDTSEFRNKLEVRRFAETFKSTATPAGQKLVIMGIIHGPQALEYHYLHGRETIDINKEDVAKEMLAQAFFNGRLARGNSLVSEHSKEAMKWSNAAAKALELVDHLNINTNKDDDAMQAVKLRVVTRTAQEANIEAIEH